MEEKRSEGVARFAFTEITLGLLGILFFIWMAFVHIASLLDKSGNAEVHLGMEIAKVFMMVTWPAFLIFFSGIGILRLKLWAWYMNVCLLPIILIVVYICRFFDWAGTYNISQVQHWAWPISFLIPLLVVIIFEILFLTRPNVKKQFK